MAGKSFEALWKHFVPRDGPPRNIQGEVLRAVAKVSHEVSINACANWDDQFDERLSVIGNHLEESKLLDAASFRSLTEDLNAIRAYAAAPAPGQEPRDALGRVRETIVAWCNQRLAAQSGHA